MLLLLAAAVAACGGSTSGSGPGPAFPTIRLVPRGDGSFSGPLSDELAEVSNNGLGYTGEIDRYALEIPAAGVLHVSLSWEAAADYDLIVAADDLAEERVAEGIEDGEEPEYVTLDVTAGQTLFVFVAGWTGDPGAYLLETLLLPPGAPLFALAEAPDFGAPWPANRPLSFVFNTDLDPAQDVEARVYLVCLGRLGEGTWCVNGPRLDFYPRLPETPRDPGGLLPGKPHALQFPRAARGLRAATGEYLTGLVSLSFEAGPPVDLVAGPPQVTAVAPNPGFPYHGAEVTLALSEPLDPATVAPELRTIRGDGSTEPLPFKFRLAQRYLCGGGLEVRLFVAPQRAPPAGTTTRLALPRTVLGISGDPAPSNALASGAGFAVDFRTP